MRVNALNTLLTVHQILLNQINLPNCFAGLDREVSGDK